MPANHFPRYPVEPDDLRHCEPVIALVADEDLAVASDKQLRKRVGVLKALGFQRLKERVDAAIILRE
jgi:hypothetical protein